MPNLQSIKLPVWFWIVAGLALLWNLAGVGAYIAQMTISAEALAKLPEAERTLYESYPGWAAAAFAIAVFGGAVGCALLMLRKQLSVPVFGLSLAGIAVQMFHSFAIANSIAVYGPGAAVMPTMIVFIGVGLLWFSNSSKGKGWLS